MLSDLRLTLRQFAKTPGQTCAILLILALGIGGNTALFSVVHGIVLRPLAYPEPDRIVSVYNSQLPKFPTFPLSPPNFVDFHARAKSFTALAASRGQSVNLLGAGEPLRLAGARVTADYFRVYGTPPLRGRWLQPEEDAAGKDNAVVITYGLWQRVFGGQEEALGRTINLSGRPRTIVGIMPPEWRRDSRTEVYLPMAFGENDLKFRGAHSVSAVGRLRDGVTPEQAEAELQTISADLAAQFPGTNKGWGAKVVSLYEDIVGNVRGILYTLLGAVGCVLLIACANIANLLLARAHGRSRELAVRAAVGADRWRLVRQLLTESALLAFLGAVLGLLLAHGCLKALVALAPGGLPRLGEIGLSPGVLAFTAAVAAATSLLAGLFPAWQATRFDLVEALKDGARGSAGGSSTAGKALVATEVALSFVLLVGAGLLLRSFGQLRTFDLGLEPRDATVVTLNTGGVLSPQDSQAPVELVRQVTEKFLALPGVKSVGVAHSLPPLNEWSMSFIIQGRPRPAPGDEPDCNYYAVTPGYLAAVRLRLLRGRWFDERDNATAPLVGVISESFARTHFPGQDPIGQRVYVSNGPEKYREIVGVVADVRPYGVDQLALPQFYDCFAQNPYNSINLIIRTDGPPLPSMLQSLRAQVFAVQKDLPITAVRPLAEIAADSIGQRRFVALLLGAFAAVAFAIAVVGVYGVMSYSVSRRVNEMGVRLALGAQPAEVRRLVVRQGMSVIAIGLAAGALGALALGRLIETQLYRTSPRDPWVFAAIAGGLALAALLACWLPARRASRVDPLVALRAE